MKLVYSTAIFKSFVLTCFVMISAVACAQDLKYYLDKATANSPLLLDLRNQLGMIKLDSAILAANYQTHLDFNSTGTYAPVINGFGYDEALSNGKTLNALFTLSQTISGRNILNAQLQGIGLQRDSVNNTSRLSEQDLRRKIIEQYILAYAGQEQLDFNKEVYDLLKNEDVILKTLTRNNVYKQTEYLTFLVTFQQQELQLKQSRLGFLDNLATLNYLSGIKDTATVRLAEPTLNLVVLPNPSKSMFLKQYELDSLRLQNSRRLLDLNYKPKIGIYADGGYNSSFIMEPYKNFGASAGFTVTIPIYDGHQLKMQHSKLTIQENTRNAYRNFFVNQYGQQVAQLNQQLRETETLFQQINEQIKFTRSLIEVNGRLLQTGDILISDYIIAINNYLNAQNLLRETNINKLKLINQLNYWNQ
jgi:outer membrane protein TolC